MNPENGHLDDDDLNFLTGVLIGAIGIAYETIQILHNGWAKEHVYKDLHEKLFCMQVDLEHVYSSENLRKKND